MSKEQIKLSRNSMVECHDGNSYRIMEIKGRYAHGLGVAVDHRPNSNQRLFKLNGQYAGADRSKNVAKVL